MGKTEFLEYVKFIGVVNYNIELQEVNRKKHCFCAHVSSCEECARVFKGPDKGVKNV